MPVFGSTNDIAVFTLVSEFAGITATYCLPFVVIQIQRRYLVYFSLINMRLFFDLFEENIFDILVGYQFVNNCVELFLWHFTSVRCSNRIYCFKLPVLI